MLEWSDTSRQPQSGPDDVVRWARTLLGTPRFLAHRDRASDLVFQDLVRRMRAQVPSNRRADRDLTLMCALGRLNGREHPLIVETGCIHWSAGYFGYVIACWLRQTGGGHLTSIDNDPDHLAVARRLLRRFGDSVELVHEPSVAWLRRNQRPIDFLYLDLLDTENSDRAEHGLQEAQAAVAALAGANPLCALC